LFFCYRWKERSSFPPGRDDQNQGGYTERPGWSAGGATKSGSIDLPIAFPTAGIFGTATSMGTAGKIGCNTVANTYIGVVTEGISNLYTYILAFGY